MCLGYANTVSNLTALHWDFICIIYPRPGSLKLVTNTDKAWLNSHHTCPSELCHLHDRTVRPFHNVYKYVMIMIFPPLLQHLSLSRVSRVWITNIINTCIQYPVCAYLVIWTCYMDLSWKQYLIIILAGYRWGCMLAEWPHNLQYIVKPSADGLVPTWHQVISR